MRAALDSGLQGTCLKVVQRIKRVKWCSGVVCARIACFCIMMKVGWLENIKFTLLRMVDSSAAMGLSE